MNEKFDLINCREGSLSKNLCGIYFKSGPCTPNFDILSWFIACIVCLGLIFKNFIQIVGMRDYSRSYVLMIHIVAGIILLKIAS